MQGPSGRTAYREARGHDAQAPVAEFGDKIVYMTSKNTSKSGSKVDAKLHDEIWLGLRKKSNESIIGTPNGVIEAKTGRMLPEDQRWCAEEVLNIRGIPSNPVPGAGGDHLPIEVNEAKHTEREEGEHTQHRSVRSVTLTQQLPRRTRQCRKCT